MKDWSRHVWGGFLPHIFVITDEFESVAAYIVVSSCGHWIVCSFFLLLLMLFLGTYLAENVWLLKWADWCLLLGSVDCKRHIYLLPLLHISTSKNLSHPCFGYLESAYFCGFNADNTLKHKCKACIAVFSLWVLLLHIVWIVLCPAWFIIAVVDANLEPAPCLNGFTAVMKNIPRVSMGILWM